MREVGDKLSPKLVKLISDTVIATQQGLTTHHHTVRSMATQTVIDKAGHEIAELIRPFLAPAIEDESVPQIVRDYLADIASGQDQVKAIGGAIGVTGALSLIVSNTLFPIVSRIVEQAPNLYPDVSVIATEAARRIGSRSDKDIRAARQGFQGNEFDAIVRSVLSALSTTEVYDLINRGLASVSQGERWLQDAAYADEIIPHLLELRKQLLSPADAALAVLRGNITHDEGLVIAEHNGISAADFETLIGNTGEPPGVMDMLTMYRRNFIDRAQLEKGIRESRVRNEWIPPILLSRFSPMSTADAIDALIQNHLPEAEARAITEQNGLEPSAFTPMKETAGEPLSKTEMLRLHRMGKATTAEVEQALRESRLKDKYISHALELTTNIPPLFAIRQMLTAGAITDAEAATLLHEDGYQDFVIKAVIRAGHKVKTVKVRTVTEGILSELYQERAITAAQFVPEMEAIGYSHAEAEQIRTVDDRRIAKVNRDAAITHLRSQYTGRKISEAVAQNELDALQVPSDMRDKLLADWNLEIKANVKSLTVAEIASAWHIQLLTAPEAIGRLTHMGYTEPDAELILELKNKGRLPS